MAAYFSALVQHLVLVCLLYAGLPNTSPASASPACPVGCGCLGNIVDCSATHITFVPDNITDYPWIEQLQLNQNPGLNLSGSALPLLPHLTVLELEKLGLLEFPDLGKLPFLTKLSLRDNELTAVGDLSDLASLRHLDLSRNSLTSLPAHLTLPHLRKLNLDRNRISVIEGTGAGMPLLQELRLVKNFLTQDTLVSSGLLRHLPALTTLNLHSNELRSLPGLVFQNCSALQVLRLSRNGLTTLSDGVFYGLSNLRTLSLDHNNLTVVSNTWLFGLSSLEDLSLRHNAISSLVLQPWQDTVNTLLSLDLSYNKLVSLHASFLNGLTSLEYLQVAHNQLSTIMPETFKNTPSLLQLDLSYNDLRWTVEDSSDSYVGLDRLQRLDLTYNKIEAVQYAALAPLTALTMLDLRGNAIRTLHDSPFRALADGGQVLLNTSSLVCDCHLAWLPDWLSSARLNLEQLNATCQYPPAMVGVSLTAVRSSELPCALSPRPVIQRSPEDRIVLLNADVQLQCEALVGSRGGEPVILWRRDNHHVEPYKLDKSMKVEKADPDGGVIMRLVSTLRLTRVTHQDAGRYQCVVRNEHGAGYSKWALIEVQVKPYFTVLPVSVSTQVDGVARLECAAEGLPPPEISLQKGGSDDFPAARERRLLVDSKDTVFFIKPMTVVDEGMYTCTANSTAGIARVSANITVRQAPYFVEPVQDVVVRPGEAAVLRCQGSGRPLPSVSWLRDGQSVSSVSPRHVSVDGGQFVIVLDVRPEDAGAYKCQLTNTYGSRWQTMRLTVMEGLLVDGQTTLALVMMAVVVCVVVTSIVWVIIIYQTRRGSRQPSHYPTLGYAPSSSDGSPQHRHLFAGGNGSGVTPDTLLGPTEALLVEDCGPSTDLVLEGPDTGSEHSAGKDSGVGDSSQRSSEDLRQLAGGGTGELVRHGVARSSLLLYAEHPHLPAISKGGSSLSVVMDSDGRYNDCRPRLSTFGSGGSATLRRPSGHRPIPVPVPCVVPGATLPHKRSVRVHDNCTDSAEPLYPGSIQYQDTNPYSRPTNRLLNGRLPLGSAAICQLPSPHYMSTKGMTGDALSSSRVSTPQYASSTDSEAASRTAAAPDDAGLRLHSPHYTQASLDPPLHSDYSTPSIVYSEGGGVHITGLPDCPPPTPPPTILPFESASFSPVSPLHPGLLVAPSAPR